MKPKARYIASVIATSKAQELQMPWARGARRAAMIARRNGTDTELQAKSA